MQSKANSVEDYLAALPEDRRATVSAVRDVINLHLPEGYEEGMQYGMIGWFVPHSRYPPGYHCDPKQPVPFAGLAAQKNYLSLYLMCVYGIEAERRRLVAAWEASGKRLDMGKSCIRFKRLDDVPLEVVGEAISRVPVEGFLAHYESVVPRGDKRPRRAAVRKAAKSA